MMKREGKYFKINEDGERIVVATVKKDHVQICLKEIRQWLTLKEMYLSIQVRCWERSTHSPEELGLNSAELNLGGREAWATLHQGELVCWRHSYGNVRGMDNYQVDSKLELKRLIEPIP